MWLTVLIMADHQEHKSSRRWRPIAMLSFICFIFLDSVLFIPFQLDPEAWEFMTFIMGAYVLGRSAEKVGPQIIKSK